VLPPGTVGGGGVGGVGLLATGGGDGGKGGAGGSFGGGANGGRSGSAGDGCSKRVTRTTTGSPQPVLGSTHEPGPSKVSGGGTWFEASPPPSDATLAGLKRPRTFAPVLLHAPSAHGSRCGENAHGPAGAIASTSASAPVAAKQAAIAMTGMTRMTSPCCSGQWPKVAVRYAPRIVRS
jgi:hypothetical protein